MRESSSSGRRRFLRTLAAAGIATAIGPGALALAQSRARKKPAAKPLPKPAPPPDAPTEIAEEARALADILRRRYPKLSADQVEAIAKDFDGDLKSGRRLRDVKLANGDEPDFTFRA